MNNSGLAVQLLTSFYKVPTSDVWIVHDDIDLPIGSMKIRFGGGTAGHHGAESIMEQLGTDKFWRFRLGIGVKSQRPEAKGQMIKNVEDFVLGNFTGAERGKVKDMVKKGSKAIQTGLEENTEAAC